MKVKNLVLVIGLIAAFLRSGLHASEGESSWAQPYVRSPAFSQLVLSPDGAYLAMAMSEGSRNGVVVLKTDAFDVSAAIDVPSNQRVISITWASPSRMVIGTGVFKRNRGELRATGDLYAVNADGADFRLVLEAEWSDVAWGRFRQERPATAGVGRVISPLLDDPDHVLVELNRRQWLVSTAHGSKIYKVNVHTAERRLVADGPGSEWAQIFADPVGDTLLASVAGDDLTTQYYIHDPEIDDWREVGPPQDVFAGSETLQAFPDAERFLIPFQQPDGGRCLVAFRQAALETGTPLVCDDGADIAGVVTSFDGSTAIAVELDGSRPALHFLDSGHADERLLKQMTERFREGGQFMVPVSSSGDGRTVLLRAWSDRVPGDYYLYHRDDNRAQYLLSSHDWIDSQQAARQEVIRISARDGIAFDAIYTHPVSQSEDPPPLVVMPHGGPFAVHDRWGWDRHVQALASRGYAVLQPNFRGSSGSGRAHLNAGREEMGGGMIRDIVDATAQVHSDGLGDAARTCIYGISYGGFAAVSAAIMAPDMYRCVITQAGLYDMNKTGWEAWRRQFRGQQRWIKQYYGPRAVRTEQSPSSRIEALRAPVLVLHGERDEVVPISHAKALVDDLEDSDKSVRTAYFEHEEHAFTNIRNRVRVLELIDAFLAENLSGAASAQ